MNLIYIMRAPYSEKNVEKRKILTKKDLMRELYACRECDCERYPWCVNLGGLCKECVDLNTYTHKLPLRSNPVKYANPSDCLSNIKQPKMTDINIKIIKTKIDGDCLYSAISLAFDGLITIEDLRYLVAINQTEDTFKTYKELATYMPEYRVLSSANSIRDFRVLIKKSGEDVGVENCIWGDENALQIISTFLRLGIKIFNEKGQYIQQIIPERTTTYDNTTPTRYVLLLLNSSKPANEHYNLLQFNNHTLLTYGEWNKLKNIISGGNRSRNTSK